MFEELTDEAREETISTLNDDLAEGSGLAVAAVEGFLADVAGGGDYREAYRRLKESLGITWRGNRSSSDERLGAVAVGYVLERAHSTAEARRRPDGLRNPYEPDASGWPQAEYLLDRLDQPVPLADLSRIAKISGSSAADLVCAVANCNLGRVAPAKSKVSGKVAYMLRASDEEPSGHGGRWSSYRLAVV
jgi:hypothetical protein